MYKKKEKFVNEINSLVCEFSPEALASVATVSFKFILVAGGRNSFGLF